MDRILIFADEGFPGYRKTGIVAWEGAVVCTAEELSAELLKDYDVFVNLHGSHFPLDAVNEYYGFLKSGKGYVQCFGTPLEYLYAYDMDSRSYVCGNRQMSYFRELNIHSVMDVCQRDVTGFRVNPENEIAKELASVLTTEDTLNFVLHTTKNAYVEAEWGSIGSMDTYIRPLVQGINQKGQAISSPIVLMENRAGAFAGSRWIFVNTTLTGEGYEKAAELLAPLAHFAACGHRELMVKPSFAMYEQGEKPFVAVSAQNFQRKSDWNVTMTVRKDEKEVMKKEVVLKGAGYPSQLNVPVEIETEPGIYQVVTEWISEDGEKQRIFQGFCVRDEAALASAAPMRCSKDYFIIDGKMQAVVGTTYMSGEVSRSYLQLPNVSNWLNDMQEMKRVGINWLRTGIWCNHRRFMLDDGHFDEHILRSIDAFVQTAATVGLHVTFTFFTFVPEAFEGSHPYLDRRSVEAQKRFIAKVVERHTKTTNIDWDLINEPFTSDHPSQTKKASDILEDQDFRKYMEAKYGDINKMLWDLDGNVTKVPSFDALALPLEQNINFLHTDMALGKNGIIWIDYIKYRMEMFKRWMLEMKEMIQEIAPGQLVTVGQDEALAAQRPTPLLYGKNLDYNTQHSWWLLDDLVWDTQFSKVDGIPTVVQETGIMYVEAPNGMPRRTEEELAKILRRKFAYSYGTKCAGAIHWIWNTNYFMNNANESNIGAIRCDKSRKPEFMVYEQFSSFLKHAEGIISDIRDTDKTAVIFPYSNDFSNRKFAYHATTHLTRLLAYNLKVPFTGIGEYDLQPLREHAFSVVFVPAAHHFDTGQFLELMEIAEEKGFTVVFTGPISYDEHFKKTDRANALVGDTALYGLDRYEEVVYGDENYLFSFGNTYAAKAFREEGKTGGCTVKQLGKGRLIWFSVPLELCNETEQLAELYRKILEEASVKVPFEVSAEGANAKLLSALFITKTEWENGSLYTLVNESSKNLPITLKDAATAQEYKVTVPAEDVALFLTDADGAMTAKF